MKDRYRRSISPLNTMCRRGPTLRVPPPVNPDAVLNAYLDAAKHQRSTQQASGRPTSREENEIIEISRVDLIDLSKH